jgi:hypothetical protein
MLVDLLPDYRDQHVETFFGYKSGFGFDTLTFKNKNPVKVYDTLKSRIDKSVWGAIL